MATKISRQEEAEIPRFDSHKEARKWFVMKYGDDFEYCTSEIYGNEICYFYNLILDREIYEEENRKLIDGRKSDGLALLNSYQSIEIMTTGSIHIIH